MALPSQSLGSTRYTRGPAAKKKGNKLAGIAAAVLFVVGAIFVIRALAGGSGDESTQGAQPAEPTQLAESAATESTAQSSAMTTEPRVISPARSIPEDNAPQYASQSNPGAQTSTTSRTASEQTAAAKPDSSPNQPPARANPSAVTPASSGAAALIREGEDLWAANKPLEARDRLNRALFDPRASRAQQAQARALLSQVNDLLVFSPRVVPGDPLARTYEIQPGDILSRIARDESVRTDWRALLRINKIADARRIRVGQKIKLLQGPFHAVVHKSSYRVDFFADIKDSAGNNLYVCSRPCGLGEYDSTPTGLFKVRRDSKLINPHWVNPRTGERFDADDPENPIGEYWIGLEGIDEETSTLLGYGIHGTIEPESIGGQESMGCIRMLPDDVALAYELLVMDLSQVEVLP